MLGGLAFLLDGLFWIDVLRHVHLVADPLLGPLIGVMSIGIMRVLYRAGSPPLSELKLSLPPPPHTHPHNPPPQYFPRLTVLEFRIISVYPFKHLSHVLPTLPIAAFVFSPA